jgi:hypothetical protein
MTNKYKGNCTLCSATVEAGKGEYDWKHVWCADCAGHVAKSDRLRLLEAINASYGMDEDDYDHEDSYAMEEYFGHDGTDRSLPLIVIWKQSAEDKAKIAASLEEDITTAAIAEDVHRDLYPNQFPKG